MEPAHTSEQITLPDLKPGMVFDLSSRQVKSPEGVSFTIPLAVIADSRGLRICMSPACGDIQERPCS
jgi:hypothetical protein